MSVEFCSIDGEDILIDIPIEPFEKFVQKVLFSLGGDKVFELGKKKTVLTVVEPLGQGSRVESQL